MNPASLYNSNYDAILYYTANGSASPNATYLCNLFLNAGKGVVLGLYADCDDWNAMAGLNLIITNYGTQGAYSANCDQTGLPVPMLYGVILYNPSQVTNLFTPKNGASSAGIVGGTSPVPALNYLDTCGYRRVDLNLFPRDCLQATSANGSNRLILQSLLWAASKIS